MSSHKFGLNVICKTYDIDNYKKLSIDEHIKIYMKMYEPDMTFDELQEVKNHLKYVRFMCFQDDTNSRAYMFAYCRRVNEMLPEHIHEAQDILNKHPNMCLGEINYVNNGYFFVF